MGTGVTSLPSSLDLVTYVTLSKSFILLGQDKFYYILKHFAREIFYDFHHFYVLSKLDTTFPNVMLFKDKPSTD
jgi:hypothetical protein